MKYLLCCETEDHLITNSPRVKMSDNSNKKSLKNSKSQKDLGQKVTEEGNKFTKNIPDVKKEIEDIINSVGEEKDSLVKRVKEARDKMMEVYQESKKHPHVVLFGVILGSSVIILACYGVMKMIC